MKKILVLVSLLLGLSVAVQAACLTALPVLAPGGPQYQEAFVNSTNQSCYDYYIDKSGNVAIGGFLTILGTSSFNGTTAVTSQTVTGSQAYTSQNFTGITSQSSWTITANASYETVLSTGGTSSGNVFVQATPSVSTATVVGGTTALNDGQILILASTGCANGSIYTSSLTFQTDGAGGLTGSRLHLGAATRTVACNKVLGLIYNAASNFWYELYYAPNP